MEWKDKTVLVVGAGISGIGADRLLEKKQARVILYDGNQELDPEKIREKLPEGSNTVIRLGKLEKQDLEEARLAVFSPGVPVDLPLAEEIKAKGIPIWGEVELAYECGKGDVLAVTGTNGKTTTTSLLGEIMKSWRQEVYVVGNIGSPYTEAVEHMTENAVTVAEISSFQLETIDRFSPRVSTILNITPDHLNRHHTMEEYIRVKELITKNQRPEDTCVLNYEDPVLREFGKTLHTKVIYFSSLHTLEEGVYLKGDIICLKDGSGEKELCSVKELKLLGRHNYENVMAAVAMAWAYGVPLEVIKKAVCAFQAVEHRIEYVLEKGRRGILQRFQGNQPGRGHQGDSGYGETYALNRRRVR